VVPARIAVSSTGDLQLPAPLRAEVKPGASNSVEVTLYCPGEDRTEVPTPVLVPLAPALARDLAIRLWLAADETEAPSK
jgi:hypothetical protein